MKNIIKKGDLLDTREYSIDTDDYGIQTAYWMKNKDGFILRYVGWLDTCIFYDDCVAITKSTHKQESILIDGVYGDQTILYLNGYIDTKYSESYKIKSVDIEKGHVYLYGNDYDFSRVGSSSPNNEDGKNEYLRYLERLIKNSKIRIGTKLEFTEEYVDALDEVLEVSKIVMPNCVDNFYPKVYFTNDDNFWEINDFKIFKIVNILHIPYTIEEQVEQIIKSSDNSSDVTNKIITYFKDNHKLKI